MEKKSLKKAQNVPSAAIQAENLSTSPSVSPDLNREIASPAEAPIVFEEEKTLDQRFAELAERQKKIETFMVDGFKQIVGEIKGQVETSINQRLSGPGPQQQQGGGGIGGVMGLVNAARELGIGPGSPGSSNVLQDRLMELAMESLSLGNTLQKAIIMKAAPEFATQLLEPKVKASADAVKT